MVKYAVRIFIKGDTGLIEVKNLVKVYGDHVAVDNLSFTVEKGQIYGFLGPNGAGKSTTMNIITGYIGMTEGTVTVNGYDVLEEPEKARRSIGYLPEQPPLYLDMTVYEYLEFAAELKGVRSAKRAEQIEQVMEMVQVTEMRDRLIKNLSKGYRQRVGLGQAIMGFPEIIILDEPTVGLDPKQILEIRDLIRQLAGEHTIILSSHILSEVQAVRDHVLIIHKGKLVACGTPDELEKQMADRKIEMTVKCTEKEAEAVLDTISGIESVVIEDTKDGVSVNIEYEAGADIREALFCAFADAKRPILMMKPAGATLETVFIKLTADDMDLHGETEETETHEEQEDVIDGGDL